MISELSGILITAISSVTGTGGIAAIFLWKHNKKMRELERQLKDSEVNKARIEGKSDEWHIWKEQNEALSALNKDLTERNKELVAMNAEKEDRHQQDIKDWESRFTDQTTYLRGVQRDLIAANVREKEHIRKEGVLLRRIQYLINFICKRTDCDHGIPPRQHLVGCKFDDSQIEESEQEKEATINLTKTD